MKFRINRNPDLESNRCEHLHNFLGFDIIEIVQFNYDGKGSALCFFDESNEFDYLSAQDIHFLLFDVHYELMQPITREVLTEKIRLI